MDDAISKINQALGNVFADVQRQWEREKKYIEFINSKTKSGELPLLIYPRSHKFRTYSYYPLWHYFVSVHNHPNYRGITICSQRYDEGNVLIASKILTRKIFEIDVEIEKLGKKKQRIIRKYLPKCKTLTMRKGLNVQREKEKLFKQYGVRQ